MTTSDQPDGEAVAPARRRKAEAAITRIAAAEPQPVVTADEAETPPAPPPAEAAEPRDRFRSARRVWPD